MVVSSDQRPHRSQRTADGFTNGGKEQCGPDGEAIQSGSIKAVRRIVRLSLNDELVTAPSEAEKQANFYREVLNFSRSSGAARCLDSDVRVSDSMAPAFLAIRAHR